VLLRTEYISCDQQNSTGHLPSSMMNDKRLDHMMMSDCFTSKIWKGFLAPDIVLSGEPKKPFPHLYIANTAPTSTGGEHWCVLIVFKDHCEFFDSFGYHPFVYNLTRSFLSHCKKIIFNETQFQSKEAQTCGHHCIFYSMLRARGVAKEDIFQLYNKNNLCHNDDMVFNFVFRHFGNFMAHIQQI